MDIMMPGMDGLEVIKQMRQRPSFKDLPVIALTAKAGDDDRRQCMAAGANAYIAKPVEPAELKAILDTFLSDGDVPD